MMRRHRLPPWLLLAMGLLALAKGAAAQRAPERVRVSISGGVLVNPVGFEQDFTRTENLEPARFSTDLRTPPSRFASAGARVRLAGPISAGVTVSLASGRSEGTIDASLPHPFYFNQPRAVSGDVDRLNRLETAVHGEVAWVAPIAPTVELTLFGGPSFFTLRQPLVTDVTYSQSFPYDAATYTSAVTATATGDAVGGNVGADVTWRILERVGVAGLVRYSRARITLSEAPGGPIGLTAGGVQAAGGVRLFF
jgi:hypothetical protein